MRGSAFPMVRNAKVHLPFLFRILDFGFSIVDTRTGNSFRQKYLNASSPESKIQNRNSKISFDDLISPLEHAAWNCQSDLFRCFKLITNSNFVACCTGKSAGLAPFKILST